MMTADDLYRQFQEELERRFPSRMWTISIFEGSPADGLYSWCPDCVVASTHIGRFEKRAENRIALLKFKVGTRKEWEEGENPFKKRYPYLSDVPTAILFMRTLDVIRIIAPRQSDLESMYERVSAYEEQISSGDWHPPLGSV